MPTIWKTDEQGYSSPQAISDTKITWPPPEQEYMAATKGSFDLPTENLVIMSLFRDCQSAIQRYSQQYYDLEWPFGNKTIVAVENDSKDMTKRLLRNWVGHDFTVHLISNDFAYPRYGSVVSVERFRNLSTVFNMGLDYILRHIPAKYVLFVESDLIYQPDLAVRLKQIVDVTNGIVAPMIYTQRDRIFYDIWGFRTLDGQGFPCQHESHFAKLGFYEVMSAGSCLMFNREVIHKGARPDDEALVGFCKQAKALGFPTYVDFSTEIVHPQ